MSLRHPVWASQPIYTFDLTRWVSTGGGHVDFNHYVSSAFRHNHRSPARVRPTNYPKIQGGCQFVTLELFREWYRWCFLKQNLFFLEKWLMHTTQWAYRRCCSWLDSFVCVQWRIHTRDMTHLYVWHGSFICVIWQCMLFGTLHIYVCDMAHVTWRVYSCDVTRLAYIQYVSFCVCDMTHS